MRQHFLIIAGLTTSTQVAQAEIPIVEWTRQLCTSSRDYASSVSVATDGSAYVAGSTEGDLDGNICAADYDMFLTKVSVIPELGSITLLLCGLASLLSCRRWKPVCLFISLILCFSVCLAGSTSASSLHVYWDISHGVRDGYSPTGRYSVLVEHLAPFGYDFSEGTTALNNVDLEAYDILVLAAGSCADVLFTAEELEAIDGYVRNGGGLLLLSEIAGSSSTAKIQQVADLFDAQIGLTKFPPDNVWSTRIDNHPAVVDVDQIYLRYSSTFSPGDLITYAWYNNMPMLAAGSLDKGRVVLIADGDLFTDPPYYSSYFDKADNRQLSVSTFAWLVPEPSSFTLLGMGALGLLAFVSRRRR